MASLGRHLLVELWDCDSRIDDVEVIGCAIDAAVIAIGATRSNRMCTVTARRA